MDPIQATTADGVVLRGEGVLGSTATWIVLVHDAGEDIDVWRPLITALADTGWNFLALDLRGHGGSDGEWDATRGHLDVDLGVNLAQRSGAEHIAIAGAGIGAVAALECVANAVDQPSFALADSLVLLSPGPLAGVDLGRLRGEGLATLIMSGSIGPAAGWAEELLRVSIGWSVSVSFPTEAQGTDLLQGEYGLHVADKIGAFLREQETQVGPGRARRA